MGYTVQVRLPRPAKIGRYALRLTSAHIKLASFASGIYDAFLDVAGEETAHDPKVVAGRFGDLFTGLGGAGAAGNPEHQ